MKVTLIRPSYYLPDGQVHKIKRPYFISATLPYLAALTPEDVEVELVEENVQDVNFETDSDLIGITAIINTAPRAYDIADEFRRRGKKVVLGGVHFSSVPEEAIQHADAVVIGEAEDVWPQVLRDFQRGELRQFYRREGWADLSRTPTPRYDLLPYKRFPLTFYPVQTSRGCPHNCAFCAVTTFFGHTYRLRPVELVVRDVQATGSRYIFFVDDNFAVNKRRTIELCQALKPLKITWVTQVEITAGIDPEICQAMAESGCKAVVVGMESISPESLKAVGKRHNLSLLKDYPRIIRIFQESGIAVVASIIFGMNGDTLESIRQTVQFLMDNNVAGAMFYTLLPYPGTPLAHRLEREGRILTKDWNLYDARHAVIKPLNMEPKELEEALMEAYRRFYALASIVKRLFLPPRPYIFPIIFYNLEYRWAALRGTLGLLTQ
jgi:radical SAM superfamily enzyme YgiQ (UPF0313 family)